MLSLWFAWLIITAGDFATLFASGYTDSWNYFPNALFNLFTPMLLGNLAAKGSVLAVTVPFLVLGLLVGDLLGRRIKLKSLRLFYNLFFLFAITAAIDEITWGSPKSIQHFKEAYNCVSTRPRPSWCAVEPPQR